ncbi:hypothetical protein [Variovorax sp. PAMC 28711]|uniref:hypothetical protein n=1 Tax=Variovorax sp. PAMC 28711 TaxID=1795631 RepID=UPI000A719793|nr:hypothetical protein [Variovorax sp. PAMC 28711]
MKPLSSFFAGVVSAALVLGCAASYALTHPNFQSAEQLLQAAIGHVRGAQQANGPTFGGHAARAIELMQQAQQEISISDEYHRGIRY